MTFPQAETPAPEKVTLTLRDVSFRYPDQPINALNALSLQANLGEHVAILGRTGCGKSTLLQLLTRAGTRNKAKFCSTIFRYPR